MGQVCAGAAGSTSGPPRDPDDKTLDELIMKEIKVEEFDSFFTKASDPLNSLVELNNGVVEAVDNIKEASSIVQGEGRIVLDKRENKILMLMFKMDSKGEEYEIPKDDVQNIIESSPELTEAAENAQEALNKLNEVIQTSVDEPTEWDIINNRVKIIKKGEFDKDIQLFNVAVFSYRKLLLLKSNEPGLKGAMRVFKDELGDNIKQLSPIIKLNEETHAPEIVFGDGSIEDVVDVEGKGATDKFPPRTKRLKKCFEEFQEAAVQACESLPSLQEQIEALLTEAKELPDKLQDALSNAGLGPGDMIKAPKNLNANIKSLSSGGQIANGLKTTIEESIQELKDACAVPSAA